VALPPLLRRPSGFIALVCALVVVVLGATVAGRTTPGPVDTWARGAVAEFWPRPGTVARAIELTGDPRTAAVLVGALVVVCLAVGRYRIAALAVAGPAVTGVVTTGLKPLVGRTFAGELAFPSGHTALATAIVLVAALLAVDLLRPARTAALLVLAGPPVAAAGLMAMTLVALDAHYATDTVGGFCTAVAVGVGVARVIDAGGDALGLPGAHGMSWERGRASGGSAVTRGRRTPSDEPTGSACAALRSRDDQALQRREEP
jgi:membrane-associated phospholipid phosphatase